MKMLLGISGTNGSGKDSVAEILVKQHGYLFIGVTELLRDEARTRGLSTERINLRTISAEWRREYGLGVLIDKAVAIYIKKGGDEKYSGLVISSLRNPGEVDKIHELNGRVVWIDADPKVRYSRITKRGRDDDKKTFEQFLEENKVEMTNSGDEATLSMSEVKAKADTTLNNNGKSITELERLVDLKLMETSQEHQ